MQLAYRHQEARKMLSQVADISDLVAAIAIIVSLLFVAFEMRATRRQTELTNWRDLLQALADYKAQTNDLELAELVLRGQANYQALGEAEKLSFGLYLEQGIHILGNFLKHNDSIPGKLSGLEGAIGNHFYEMLTSPGGADWWAESKIRGRFMPDTYVVTNALLDRRKASGGAPLNG